MLESAGKGKFTRFKFAISFSNRYGNPSITHETTASIIVLSHPVKNLLTEKVCHLTNDISQRRDVLDLHTFFLVGGVVLGENAQQWSQLEPPLALRDTLIKVGVANQFL